jgi:flagellum-specific ATP synthase
MLARNVAACGILDGHIVMERGIAERGRYSAINVRSSPGPGG